tara:strand:- start:427 stop:651 length:225 start_codon:yes stop_codon:yes gene_type:complete
MTSLYIEWFWRCKKIIIHILELPRQYMARYRLTMESERTNETTQHVFKNKDELIEHLLDFIDMVAYYNPYLEVE